MTKLEKLPKPVRDLLEDVKKYKPEKIILFGSYATGKPKKDSDVDLLVIKKTKKGLLDRQREIVDCLLSSVPSDIIVLTPEEFEQSSKEPNYFMREILQYGKVIL